MSPRVIVKLNKSFSPMRFTPNFTWEPFGPFSVRIARSLVTFLPTNKLSSTVTMRSPAISPTFSEGPPWMTALTCIVSFCIVNWIPIPLKLPSNSEFTSSRFWAGIYVECGSSSARFWGMAFSTRSVMFTVSTYWSSTIRSNAFSLLEEPLMIPKRLPAKCLA